MLIAFERGNECIRKALSMRKKRKGVERAAGDWGPAFGRFHGGWRRRDSLAGTSSELYSKQAEKIVYFELNDSLLKNTLKVSVHLMLKLTIEKFNDINSLQKSSLRALS